MKKLLYVLLFVAVIAAPVAMLAALVQADGGAATATPPPASATATATATLQASATVTLWPTATASATPPPAALVVVARALNLRACAGVDCPILAVLQRGQAVAFAGEMTTTQDGARWLLVQAGGLTGWVNSKYTSER